MEKKKSLVLQAKELENFQHQGKIWYKFGVAFKNKDTGLFHTTDKNQTYFIEGHEVEYEIEYNTEEPKRSKIKPVEKKVDNTTTEAQKSVKTAKNTSEGHVKDNFWMMKKFDALNFTPAYAKDICVAKIEKGTFEDGDFEKCGDIILKWWHSKIEEIKNN